MLLNARTKQLSAHREIIEDQNVYAHAIHRVMLTNKTVFTMRPGFFFFCLWFAVRVIHRPTDKTMPTTKFYHRFYCRLNDRRRRLSRRWFRLLNTICSNWQVIRSMDRNTLMIYVRVCTSIWLISGNISTMHIWMYVDVSVCDANGLSILNDRHLYTPTVILNEQEQNHTCTMFHIDSTNKCKRERERQVEWIHRPDLKVNRFHFLNIRFQWKHTRRS